jgi:hypothetical protein
MNEYVIWGKPCPTESERLLLTKSGGHLITDRKTAEQLCKVLTEKYNCTDVRIQEIDLSYPQSINKLFSNTINT